MSEAFVRPFRPGELTASTLTSFPPSGNGTPDLLASPQRVKGYKTREDDWGIRIEEWRKRQSPSAVLFRSQPQLYRVLGVPCQSRSFLPRQFVSS